MINSAHPVFDVVLSFHHSSELYFLLVALLLSSSLRLREMRTPRKTTNDGIYSLISSCVTSAEEKGEILAFIGRFVMTSQERGGFVLSAAPQQYTRIYRAYIHATHRHGIHIFIPPFVGPNSIAKRTNSLQVAHQLLETKSPR